MPHGRKLAAILFADIAGFTSELHADEGQGLDRRKRVQLVVTEQAGKHSGRLVKSLGDGFMIEFPSAVDAVRCAFAIQQELETDPAEGDPPRVRIGIHSGDVVEEEGDLFGNPVNIASRLQAAARPGGVCVSGDVYRQVRAAVRLDSVPVEQEELPRLPEPVEALHVRPAEERLPVSGREQERSSRPVAADRRGTGWVTLEKARKLAELEDDAPPLLWIVGGAVRAAVLGAVCSSLADLARPHEHWQQVAFILAALGKFCSRAPLYLIAWFVLSHILPPLWRRLGFLMLGPTGIDEEISEKCAEVGNVSPGISGPLERALNAYVGIGRIGRDDVWIKRKVAVEKFTKQARRELLTLLEKAQQLGKVEEILARFAGDASLPPHYRELSEIQRAHCEQLARAADMFEQAEAELSRAFLALTRDEARPTETPGETLRELGATFEAISELLEGLDDTAGSGRYSLPGTPEEAQRTQTVRR